MLGADQKGGRFPGYLESNECKHLLEKNKWQFISKLEIYFLIMLTQIL